MVWGSVDLRHTGILGERDTKYLPKPYQLHMNTAKGRIVRIADMRDLEMNAGDSI